MKHLTWVFSALLLILTSCSDNPGGHASVPAEKTAAPLTNESERPHGTAPDLASIRYTASFLGDIVPQSLNNQGEVVGLQKSGFGAFYYKRGAAGIVDLNLPDCAYELGQAGQRAQRAQINDLGQVLVTDQHGEHYFYEGVDQAMKSSDKASCALSLSTDREHATRLPSLAFLNNNSQILTDSLGSADQWQFWQWDTMTHSRTQLARKIRQALGDLQLGRATAFNKQNDFLGSLLHRNNASGCFLYQGQRNKITLLEEPVLGATGSICQTTKLTDSGYIVGQRRTELRWRDYLWLPFNKTNTESYSDAQSQLEFTPFARRLKGASDGHWLPGKATDVSNHGLVVGFYELGRGESSAYAFDSRSGSYVNLNSRLASGSAEGWHFTKALATNDNGEIVVEAHRIGAFGNAGTGAFLLQPVKN